jgi:anti-sigma B factor antagonist
VSAVRGELPDKEWALSGTDAITTSVEHRDDVTLLTVGEVVDLATAPALEEAIDALLAEEPKALIVDLSAVTFLASVGLRLLVSTHEKVTKSGQFAVVASGPITSRPIQLTRLDQVFAMYSSLDEALAGVRTRMVNGQ